MNLESSYSPSPTKLEITGIIGYEETPVVALLFLIIDDFPYEHIWLKWAENNPNVLFFFHAKNEELVKSQFVKSRLVSREGKFPAPNWGTINLTKAMFLLLNKAIITQKISSFVFLSESCIPIMTVDQFLFYMQFSGEKSWIKLFTEPNDEYSDKYQFSPLWAKYTKKKVGKSDQWIMLSNKHATMISTFVYKNPTIWASFENIRASDEMFFSTILAITMGGIENMRREIVDRRITMMDWTEHKANPKTFTHITKELVNICLNDFGSAFMRKIKLPCQMEAAASEKSCTRLRIMEQKKQLYIEWLIYTRNYSNFFASLTASIEMGNFS